MCEVQRRSAEAPRWECAWHSRGAQGTRGPEQNEKFLGPRTEFLRFLGLKVVCRHLSLGVVSSQRRHLLETGLCRRFPHMLSCPEPQSCLGLDCYPSRRAGKHRPCFFGIWLLGNLCPPPRTTLSMSVESTGWERCLPHVSCPSARTEVKWLRLLFPGFHPGCRSYSRTVVDPVCGGVGRHLT